MIVAKLVSIAALGLVEGSSRKLSYADGVSITQGDSWLTLTIHQMPELTINFPPGFGNLDVVHQHLYDKRSMLTNLDLNSDDVGQRVALVDEISIQLNKGGAYRDTYISANGRVGCKLKADSTVIGGLLAVGITRETTKKACAFVFLMREELMNAVTESNKESNLVP